MYTAPVVQLPWLYVLELVQPCRDYVLTGVNQSLHSLVRVQVIFHEEMTIHRTFRDLAEVSLDRGAVVGFSTGTQHGDMDQVRC